MEPAYYSVRQANPYRGLIQVIDAGEAHALSMDGERWEIRCRNKYRQFWPVGFWSEQEGGQLRGCPQASAILEAMERRPPVPFSAGDRTELWLLQKDTGLPLALLQTLRTGSTTEKVSDPTWRPFAIEDNTFVATCLASLDRSRRVGAWPTPHRDVLARQVNAAARPHPMAQWFTRDPSGAGLGGEGTRIPDEWIGRRLGRSQFPELLVDEHWAGQLEARLVQEYHEWHAAALLTHAHLARRTRRRLENAACAQPERLLKVYRLIPEFVDRQSVEIAMVGARLMHAM